MNNSPGNEAFDDANLSADDGPGGPDERELDSILDGENETVDERAEHEDSEDASAEDDEFYAEEEREDEDFYADDLEDDEDEMSLEALSAAYAEALANSERATDPAKRPSDDAQNVELAEETTTPKTKPEKRREIDWESQLESELQACPISPESIVEAILFVGAPRDTKLTSRKIASIIRDVSPTEVTKIAKSLGAYYDKQNYAFEVHSERGVHQIQLRKEIAEVQRYFLGRDKPVRLNQAVIDVLAVVAYNQPVTKDEIEKIRARSSGGILNQLVRRNLVSVTVTDEKPKRRFYETTDRFLDLFELESITDLPEIELFMGD